MSVDSGSVGGGELIQQLTQLVQTQTAMFAQGRIQGGGLRGLQPPVS